jgi:hypothetical protein
MKVYPFPFQEKTGCNFNTIVYFISYELSF